MVDIVNKEFKAMLIALLILQLVALGGSDLIPGIVTCEVLGCQYVKKCFLAPTGAVCMCMDYEPGLLCHMDSGNPSDWDNVKTVVSEERAHTAYIIVMVIFIVLFILLGILLKVHCSRVNSKRTIVRKRYKDVRDKGYMPTDLPPEWFEISNEVIKQTLCCKKDSSLIEDYQPMPRNSLSRKQLRSGMDMLQKDDLRLLNSRTDLPMTTSRTVDLGHERQSYSLLNEIDVKQSSISPKSRKTRGRENANMKNINKEIQKLEKAILLRHTGKNNAQRKQPATDCRQKNNLIRQYGMVSSSEDESIHNRYMYTNTNDDINAMHMSALYKNNIRRYYADNMRRAYHTAYDNPAKRVTEKSTSVKGNTERQRQSFYADKRPIYDNLIDTSMQKNNMQRTPWYWKQGQINKSEINIHSARSATILNSKKYESEDPLQGGQTCRNSPTLVCETKHSMTTPVTEFYGILAKTVKLSPNMNMAECTNEDDSSQICSSQQVPHNSDQPRNSMMDIFDQHLNCFEEVCKKLYYVSYDSESRTLHRDNTERGDYNSDAGIQDTSNNGAAGIANTADVSNSEDTTLVPQSFAYTEDISNSEDTTLVPQSFEYTADISNSEDTTLVPQSLANIADISNSEDTTLVPQSCVIEMGF